MAIIKAFKGFRPRKELAKLIASRPYDVLSSEEARVEAGDNKYSYYHVIKSEIDFPEDVDHYSAAVYNKAKDTLEQWIADGTLKQDPVPCIYIYAQTMWGKTQYGIMACASVKDYLDNVIRKHELTRFEKEIDRKTHIRVTNFNCEPVFFAFRDHAEINDIINNTISDLPEYDFVSADDIRHQLWVIDNPDSVGRIEAIFRDEVPFTYVADGHHRTAAAAHVGEERKKSNPEHSGNEEYNYFMAVHFPASQLTIIDYNRLVTDLNGYTANEFIEKISLSFDVSLKGREEYKPTRLHEFSMYIEDKWYAMMAKPGTFNDNDPIGSLDVTVLSKTILEPVLDIKDLRQSKRIDFVGGIRGLGELKKRVDSGEMAAAFALYPVSMEQLMNIADSGNIMPPKTTWFEPKLRSGLVLHCLE
ncbi:MAG: DUF1015 domain-containing protein [Bacteroidales bacterium]|nr:DUF1015 domain-containing protein [Bacteroidales bacterium]